MGKEIEDGTIFQNFAIILFLCILLMHKNVSILYSSDRDGIHIKLGGNDLNGLHFVLEFTLAFAWCWPEISCGHPLSWFGN